MGDFDFLRRHGFGVVYGADAVRRKINELGHTDPTKEKKMNENLQTVTTDPVTLDHFVLGLDDEGNEVKIKVDPTGELVMDDADKADEEPTLH